MSLQVAVLEGSAFQRGCTYGTTFSDAITLNLTKWKAYIKARHGIDASEFISACLSATNFMSCASQYCPDLLEEVRGIAEGSGHDFNTLFCFQLLPEEWMFDPMVDTSERCSIVGVKHKEKTIMGQNIDMSKFYSGSQTLLHVKEENGDECYSITSAGLLILCGVNKYGIALCASTLAQLRYRRIGLPATFVVRLILRCKTLEEVGLLISRIPHVTGMAYCIASPVGLTSFEVSCSKVVERTTKVAGGGEGNNLCRTNHPIANDDMSSTKPFSESTLNRLKFLRSKLKRDSTIEVSVDTIKEWLSSPPLYFPEISNDGTFTFTTVVMSMPVVGHPELHVAPFVREWTSLSFSDSMLDRHSCQI